MTTKRKIVVMAVVVFIALIMLTSSFVFMVKKVDAQVVGGGSFGVEEQVIEYAGIKKNTNIFFINKTKAINSIEKNLAEVKVEKIERKFPNAVLITVSFRHTLFYVREDDETNVYDYVLDGDLKVIDKYTVTLPAAFPADTIELKGVTLGATEKGDFYSAPIMKSFLRYFLTHPHYSLSRIRTDFKSIELSGSNIIVTTSTNSVITLRNVMTSTKLLSDSFLSILNQNPTQFVNSTGWFEIVDGQLAGNTTPNP